MRFEDPYEILGLKPGAAEEEVRAAYEKLLEDEEQKEKAQAAYDQICGGTEKADSAEEAEVPADAEQQEEQPVKEETEDKPAAEKPQEEVQEKSEVTMEKGSKPGQIALGVLAIVVLAAVLVALVLAAIGGKEPTQEETAPQQESVSLEAESQVPADTTPATIPADGNPDDETCKGSYTASNEEVLAAADTVVASMKDFKLTNAQLQIYYWMGIQSYVQNSGPYLQFMGLDLNKPLDSQVCPLVEGRSWQQFFLQQAFSSWQNYQSMAAEAEAAGYELEEAIQAALKTLPQDMETDAKNNGFESAEQLLANNVGVGAAIEDYVHFMEVYHKGYGHFAEQMEAAAPTDQQMEDYYKDHEEELKEGGISKDNKVATVRHILIAPEDPESEADWPAAEEKAKEILDQFLAGDRTSESFAKLAGEYTMDPGSKETGGLYEDFAQGQMVPPFDQWSFDENRKNGDTDIVKTDFGYHIMYYVSSRPVWQDQVSQVILKEFADQFIADCASKYPMDVDYSAVVLGELQAQ